MDPLGASAGARFAFVSPLSSPDNETLALLVGVTDLSNNPYLTPLLQIFEQQRSGSAFVTDRNGSILIHSDQDRILQSFNSNDLIRGQVDLDIAPDGSRRLILVEPVEGYPWDIVVVTPRSA